MLNFALAYRFVLSIQADTKATAFGSGPPVTRLTLGFSDSQIRALGRWKSDAFKLYIRNETLVSFLLSNAITLLSV